MYNIINNQNQPPPTPSLQRRGIKPNILIDLAPSFVRSGLGVVDFGHSIFIKSFLLSLSIIIFNSLSSYSQNSSSGQDSISKKFPEVRVEASRIMSNTLSEFSPNSLLDKRELERLGNIQISDALIYIPGLFIKDYGGLGGMKTVSVRGTSANQTLIMLNGIRLNSNQNGMTDLSNIPLSFIGNVEIVRTGFSAAFGGNALGGAINIIPERTAKDKLEISSGYGSFNENILSLNVVKNFGDFSLRSSFEYKHSNGDYPIEIHHFGENSTVTRSNSDFSNYSAVVSADYNIEKVLINAFAMFFDTKRGVPGAVLQGHIESPVARMNESGVMLSTSVQSSIGDDWHINGGINARVNNLNYKDDNFIGIGGKPLDNDFISNDYNLNLGLKNDFDNGSFQFNIESFHTELDGDMLQPEIGRNPKRNGIAFSLITNKKYDVLNFADATLAGALRADFFNVHKPAYSPFAGLIINPHKTNFNLKINASGNFRLPSFNELYYLNYGTANLKPERSVSLNLGIAYKYESLYFEINGFRMFTNDLIVSIPRSPAIWSAQNIGKSENTGIELIVNYADSNSPFRIDLNYTRQIAQDMTENSMNYGNLLVYVPQEIINANISYKFLWDIITALNINYTSFRYSLASNDIASVLPEYYTINFRIIKNLELNQIKFNFFASADNITNENYAVVRNFPMPGRIFRAGIGIGIWEN